MISILRHTQSSPSRKLIAFLVEDTQQELIHSSSKAPGVCEGRRHVHTFFLAMNSLFPRLVRCKPGQKLLSCRIPLQVSRSMANLKDKAAFIPLPENHYVLSGFTPFASRADLKLALGQVNPSEIHPLLDRKLFFVGKYEIVIKPDEIAMLKENVKKYNGSLSLHTTIYSDQIFNATQLNITSQCIRVVNFTHLAVHDVEYFFEDFHLVEPGIQRIRQIPFVRQNFSKVDQKAASQFLIRFSDEFEAERAMMELDGKGIKDCPSVRLLWYRA
ncbi:hypothetical protein EON65_19145 [archaeon]|nr:MAG: hypothetical protein EON65_19145 [archaeon]